MQFSQLYINKVISLIFDVKSVVGWLTQIKQIKSSAIKLKFWKIGLADWK